MAKSGPRQEPGSLQIIRSLVQAMGNADATAMDRLRSPDFVLDWVHGDAFEDRPLNQSQTRDFWPAWFAGFSTMDFEATRTIAAESVVVVQWIFSGVHDHTIGPPVFNPPARPTHRTVRLRGVSIYDVTDGQIQAETTYLDLATLMVELAISP